MHFHNWCWTLGYWRGSRNISNPLSDIRWSNDITGVIDVFLLLMCLKGTAKVIDMLKTPAQPALKMNHTVLHEFIRVLTRTSAQIYTHFIKDVLCLLVRPSLMSLVESRDYQECVSVSSWKYFSCCYFYIDLIVIFFVVAIHYVVISIHQYL